VAIYAHEASIMSIRRVYARWSVRDLKISECFPARTIARIKLGNRERKKW